MCGEADGETMTGSLRRAWKMKVGTCTSQTDTANRRFVQGEIVVKLIKIVWSRSLGRVIPKFDRSLRRIDCLWGCLIPRSNIRIPRSGIHKCDQDWKYDRRSSVLAIRNGGRRSVAIAIWKNDRVSECDRDLDDN